MIAACASTDGGDGGDDGNDPPPTGTPVCGDAVCSASEIGICSADCGTGGGPTEACNNGMCEGNEPSTCPQDCQTTATCGNQMCDNGETNATCPGDCTGGGGGMLDCADPAVLFACILCIQGTCVPPATNAAECQACVPI